MFACPIISQCFVSQTIVSGMPDKKEYHNRRQLDLTDLDYPVRDYPVRDYPVRVRIFPLQKIKF
jgi:hypothetical protein